MRQLSADPVQLAAVLALALAARLWTCFADLPYPVNSDEVTNLGVVLHIVKTGDLNPHFFNYPSFLYYAHALALLPYFLVAEIADPVTIVMGTTFLPSPGVVVIGRLLNVLSGVGLVALVYATGRLLRPGNRAAIVAATLTAISPTLVAHSRWVTPDMPVTFWVIASLLGSVLIAHRGTVSSYVVAGIAAGCAAGTKYNGGLAIVCVVLAHLLRTGWRGAFAARLWLAVSLALVAFFVTTPFAILDFRQFAEHVAFERGHYATGHPGTEGDSFAWYVGYLWRTEGVIAVLAVAQIARGLFDRSKDVWLLAMFPVIYIAIASGYEVRNERILLLALPFLHVLAAMLVADTAVAVGVVLVALCIAAPIRTTIQEAQWSSRIDSRTTARIWIDANLPHGSRIALEAYSPFVDGAHFSLHPISQLIDRPAEWYVQQKIEYLLFSQGMYRRYYREPAKYAREIALYDALFRRFPPAKVFSDGDFEIRIHHVE